jgi:CelD/BcsL family acetyltransferase involved in cellulose biosynthesis
MAPQIEIITSRERFAQIRSPWDKLFRDSDADVFQNHRWIAAWLDTSDGWASPRIAVAWRDGALLAALPLAVRRRFGLRTLEWSAQSLSDYCDALATPDTVSHLPALWDAVWNAGGFELVDLEQVRPGALARPLLDRDGVDRTTIERRGREERCFAIERIWPNGEAWFRSLGKKGRNNFWRGERILEAAGGNLAFHCLDPAERSIEAELQQCIALKRAWLRTTKPRSLLLGRDGKALEVMFRAASCAGLLRLFLITCGDRMAAASVNFVYGDRMQAYMTSYDPSFDRGSPGMILIVNYTRWAFDHGLGRVDFLRGDEQFKSRLANTEIGLNRYVGARTAIGKAVLAAHRWRSRLRFESSRSHREEEAPEPSVPGSPRLAGGD